MAQTETNDNRIAVMVDTQSYASKPDSSEVGKVKARMRKRGPVLLSPEDVFQALVSGHSVIPAEMVGGVRSDDWKSQRLFMVDIDGGATVQEVAERYEDAGLSPAFVYHTYSSAEGCEKFRFAFLADDCVQNGTARDIIQATLMGIAGCADEKCADRARYFNGTDKGGEFFGSEVDTERLLCLWDDSYASYLPQIGKKVAKTENTAKKEQKRKSGASGRSYDVILSDNIIPFSRGLFRMNAKHDLGMLDRFFKARAWVEGDHRERFCFVYYNLAKLVYGAEEAYTLVKEKVSQMQEPLSDRELYWAITHTEDHIETAMPDLHGDGVFLFHRKTIASDKWLEMTDEEAIACGIFATSDKNARADKNRGVKRERDELIASLFVDGKSVREIKSILDERYGDLSLGKRSIEKMRKKMCEKIPPTIFLYNISHFYSPQTLPKKLVRMVASATRNGFSASQERFLHSVLHGNRNLLLSGIDAPNTSEQFVRILGRINKGRGYKYILRKYISPVDYIDKYNLFIPEANNSGTFGETLTLPIVAEIGDITADTFLCAGLFDTKDEPENFSKYMKTKFFRALLGVNKVTQHCPPVVWRMVPIQNFTTSSDIHWDMPIASIDQQLYVKYGLTQEEVDFIETHVKEME